MIARSSRSGRADGADRSGGRGRDADRPGEIPATGWKDVAWRVYKEMSDDHVLLIAAGVTFYLLLALGPLLAALVSIYGLVLDPADIAAQAEALAGVVPGGAVDVLILGGELNSEMEHQTRRDATTGEAEPMGQRGAAMADDVGECYGR